MVKNNLDNNMNILNKLEKALPQNTFLGSQDLSFDIENYTIELDKVTLCLFGYEGKMSLTINADQQGFKLAQKCKKILDEKLQLPLSQQLEAKNSQSNLYIKTHNDLLIVQYCIENILQQLQKIQDQLPSKITAQVEYIENPFG